MRSDQTIPDSATLPARRINDVLSFRLLNGNRDGGAHTMILSSAPRPPGPNRGQYHTSDEEFFVLDGDFTFDGSTWFCEGSYAFYPAGCVHGAKVDVRGGYEVYLRISGATETRWEDQPKSDRPYPAEGVTLSGKPVQMRNALETAPRITSAPDGVLARRVRGERDAGTVLLRLVPGQEIAIRCAELVEVFVLAGRFATCSGDILRRHGYLARTSGMTVGLTCVDAGELLVSHEAKLSLST